MYGDSPSRPSFPPWPSGLELLLQLLFLQFKHLTKVIVQGAAASNIKTKEYKSKL